MPCAIARVDDASDACGWDGAIEAQARFTAPALALPWTLPAGVMADAARLGLAFSLLAGPAALLIARRIPRNPA